MTYLLIYTFIMASILGILMTIYKKYMRGKYLSYIVEIIKINVEGNEDDIYVKIPYNNLKEIVNARKKNIIPKLKASIIRNNKELRKDYGVENIKDIEIGKDENNNIYFIVLGTYIGKII